MATRNPNIEQIVKEDMWAALVDQDPEMFDCGEPNATRLAEDAIDNYDLDFSENSPVWDWAHETCQRWESTGQHFTGSSVESFNRAASKMTGVYGIAVDGDYDLEPVQSMSQTDDFWNRYETEQLEEPEVYFYNIRSQGYPKG